MKRTWLVLFATLLFSMAAPPPSPAGESPRRQAAAPARDAVAVQFVKELQAGLPAWVKEKDVPGVAVADGYLTFNGTRCREYLPGLFFTYDGEALDFRGTVATFRNIALIRTRR